MKLSLVRKLGLLHVIGGEFRRVVKQHRVFTGTLSSAENEQQVRWRNREPPPPRFGNREKWVFAEPGDLAVEILKVKGGELLGYSYLSGAAIQLNAYTGDGSTFPSCFGDPVRVRWLRFPTPAGFPALAADEKDLNDGYMKSVFGFLMDAKYGDADLAMFAVQFDDDNSARECAMALTRLLGYEHAPDDGSPANVHRAHVFASIRGPKGSASIHGQPAGFEQPWCATQFQVGLVLSTSPKPLIQSVDAEPVGGQSLRP